MKGLKAKKSTTYDLVVTALLIALVLIAIKFINIKLPIGSQGGLIHFGNVMIYIATLVFGTRKGAIAGSVGMALFDILSGWAVWAPFTFVIRWIMSEIIGIIAVDRGKNGAYIGWNIIAIAVSGAWMIVGYYCTEVILYRNWLVALGSMAGDAIQVVVSAVIALPLVKTLQKSQILLKGLSQNRP